MSTCKRTVQVRSAVIDWPLRQLTITDTDGGKHILPLDQEIRVTMVGYPAREEKTMLAGELGPFMSKGYHIERIMFEEEAKA